MSTDNMNLHVDITASGEQIGDLTGSAGSGISWIEQQLAQYAQPGSTKMGSNTPQWLQPLWQQLVSAFGVSSSGSGQLNFGHNIGQEWVTGAMGASSSPSTYSALDDLLQQFIQNYQTQGNVSSSPYAPPTNPNGTNPGFFASSPFMNSYVVGTPGSTPVLNQGGAVLPSLDIGSGIRAGVNPGSGSMVPINVYVTVQGNVSTEQDLVEAIGKGLVDKLILAPSLRHMTLGGVGL